VAGRQCLRAWLFTVMHNVFVNQIRSAAATRTVPVDEALLDSAAVASSDRLELRDLDRALQLLPEEQREVVLLVGLEELSYEEAAGVLEIPVGTVMSRLSRGRERLRRVLSGDSGSPALKVIK
jgi:RNA polymerase sigma-70 factor (ECF subfamily)